MLTSGPACPPQPAQRLESKEATPPVPAPRHILTSGPACPTPPALHLKWASSPVLAPRHTGGPELKSEPTRVNASSYTNMCTSELVSVSDLVPVFEVAVEPLPVPMPQHMLTFWPLCPSESAQHCTSNLASSSVPSEPVAETCTEPITEARAEATVCKAVVGAAPKAAQIMADVLLKPMGPGPPAGNIPWCSRGLPQGGLLREEKLVWRGHWGVHRQLLHLSCSFWRALPAKHQHMWHCLHKQEGHCPPHFSCF